MSVWSCLLQQCIVDTQQKLTSHSRPRKSRSIPKVKNCEQEYVDAKPSHSQSEYLQTKHSKDGCALILNRSPHLLRSVDVIHFTLNSPTKLRKDAVQTTVTSNMETKYLVSSYHHVTGLSCTDKRTQNLQAHYAITGE